MRRRGDRTPGGDELFELAALADGSLPEDERTALEARVAGSPELNAALAEQRLALSVLRDAAPAQAPAGLRARVEAQRRGRRGGRRLVVAGGLATAAVAALVVSLVLALPEGAGGPSVAQAATLAERAATAPAPPVRRDVPALLDASVAGVPFPNWRDKFSWRATGRRADRLDGRSTTTVFYVKKGKRIAYTIVSGKALDVPKGAVPARREGVLLRTFDEGGRLVVTWLRDGRTCVLSGVGVKRAILLKLAAWKGKGKVPF